MTPFSDVLLVTVKTVNFGQLLVESKSALRVSYSFFLFGFEEYLQDVDHATGVKDGTMLGEELPRDGRQPFVIVFFGTASGLTLTLLALDLAHILV